MDKKAIVHIHNGILLSQKCDFKRNLEIKTNYSKNSGKQK